MAVVGVLAEALVGDEQDRVAERRAQCPQRLLHDALVVQRVIDAIYRSARDKREITLG